MPKQGGFPLLLTSMNHKAHFLFILVLLARLVPSLNAQSLPVQPQPFSHISTVPLWVPQPHHGPVRQAPPGPKPISDAGPYIQSPLSLLPDPDMQEDGAPRKTGAVDAAYDVQVLKGFVANNMSVYTPGDNSMGISDGGFIVNADNYCVDFYRDLPDTLQQFQLHRTFFQDTTIGGFGFDPRVIYDRYENRFIVIALLYNRNATNYMLISFSRDENPLNGWNHYRIRTDSLDDGQWMDFPSVGMNKGEVYISGHMASDAAVPADIMGNKLFQIQKAEGYAGTALKMKIWYDIQDTEGDFVHTLTPLSEAMMKDSYNKGMYFVSTKDLDNGQSSDKLFWYHINDDFDAPGLAMTQGFTNSLVAYENAGNAAQLGSNDPISLSSAKVHSGFYMDSVLNFVYCRNFNGYSVIVLNRYDLRTGVLFRYPWGNTTGLMNYSFPSIAFSGIDSTDADNITLGFLRTGVGIFPEIAAVHFDDGAFWNLSTVVKPGEGPVDYQPGPGTERIGDYITMQRRYNANPPRCWLSADYPNGANANHWGTTYSSNTYIAELGEFVAQAVNRPHSKPVLLMLYPNPASDKCWIEAEDPRNLIHGYRLLDVNGRLIAAQEWDALPKQEIPVLGLPAGIYTLMIQLNKGKIQYEKIVIHPLD